MKRVISVLAILSLLIPLSARAVSISNPLDSPLYSVSYYGRFADVFANPAALPLIETETGPFAVSTVFSDDYDASLFHSQPLSMLNKQKWDLSASFIADYIALTAFYGTAFDKYSDDPSLYDIRSSLRIELDMAYAIPHFSFGARISGGNSMIRQSKRITGFFDIFANAWFSPFERESGSLVIRIRLATPTPGIWTLEVYNEQYTDGSFHIQLPGAGDKIGFSIPVKGIALDGYILHSGVQVMFFLARRHFNFHDEITRGENSCKREDGGRQQKMLDFSHDFISFSMWF